MVAASTPPRERVFAACEQLDTAQERVTVAAVRRQAQVSMQEASEGVRAWRDSRTQAQAVPEPPEAVARALRAVWGTALSTARTEAEHLTAEARQAQVQAEAEAADLLTAVAETETGRDQAQAELERTRAELDRAQTDLAQGQAEAAAAHQARSREEGRREQAEVEAERLRGELAGTRDQLQTQLQDQRRELSALREGAAEIGSLRAELTAAQERLRALGQ